MNEDPGHRSLHCLPRPRASRAVGVIFLLALLGGDRSADAQYMFLDVNGDSINTYEDFEYLFDRLNEPTTLDVYLITNQSMTGHESRCLSDPSSQPGLNSYTLNLYSVTGTVSFSDVENRVPGMTESVPLVTYPYALSVGYSGTTTLPPGKYHLLRMTVTINATCPALQFRMSSCYSPPGVVTSFGAGCAGSRGDDVLRFGEDWLDAAGIGSCLHSLPRPGSVSSPAQVVGQELKPLTFTATVFDPDCGIMGIGVGGLPLGATLPILGGFFAGEATATVSWRPTRGQAGVYPITFFVSEYFQSWTAACTTRVTILPANTPPVAEAGGPYSGIQNVPISFDGTQSSDPEGGPLQYVWEFGDGARGTGPTPGHTYGTGGTFSVILTVIDPEQLAGWDGTIATVTNVLHVRVFATKTDKPTKFPNGNPFTRFQVEPTAGAGFPLEEIVPSSVRLHYEDPSCGRIDIPSTMRKSHRIGDTDGNGVAEYRFSFARDDLAALVPCLPHGKTTIPLELWGSLSSGGLIQGQFEHTFVVKGHSFDVAVSPNPLKPTSTLEFTTTEPGFVKAQLFDIQGRLVATFMDEPSMEPGYHRVPTGGFEVRANRLPSGIYFVRVATEHNGQQSRAVMILK